MAISSHVDRPAPAPRQAGFTLFEMLVALAIGAIFAASLAGLSRTISPQVQLRADAERIAGDFERARLQARRSGAPVTVRFDAQGYQIEALDLSGDWGEADVRVDGAPLTGGLWRVSSAPFTARPGEITLIREGASARIALAPASGRVEVRIETP